MQLKVVLRLEDLAADRTSNFGILRYASRSPTSQRLAISKIGQIVGVKRAHERIHGYSVAAKNFIEIVCSVFVDR